MNLNPNQKIEISHDILAREVYARIGAEEKMRLKITQFLRERYDHYVEDEANGKKGEKLSKKDLNYIAPYLDRVKLTPGQQEFIRASRKAVRNRQITFWTFLVLFVMALAAVAFVFYRLKVEADSAKVEAEENLKDANFNLAKLYETKAETAWDKKEYAQSFHYTLRALDQDIGSERLLPIANGRLLLREQCPCPDLETVVIEGKKELEEGQVRVDRITFPSPEATSGTITRTENRNELRAKIINKYDFYLPQVNSVLSALAVSADGTLIFSAHPVGKDKSRIYFWSVQNQQISEIRMDSCDFQVANLMLASNQRIALGGTKGEVEVWEIEGENPKVAKIRYQKNMEDSSGVSTVALSASGKYLAAGFNGGALIIWDKSTPPKVISRDSVSVSDFSFSADEKYLAVATKDLSLLVYEFPGLSVAQSGKGSLRRQNFSRVLFHPSQPILATGSDSGEISLWKINPAGDLVLGAYLKVFLESVTALAFSPDEKFLLAGSKNGQVREMPLLIRPFGIELSISDFILNPYSGENREKQKKILKDSQTKFPFSWDEELLKVMVDNDSMLLAANIRYFGPEQYLDKRSFEAYVSKDFRFETVLGGTTKRWAQVFPNPTNFLLPDSLVLFEETKRTGEKVFLKPFNNEGDLIELPGEYSPWKQVSGEPYAYHDRLLNITNFRLNGKEQKWLEVLPGEEVNISLDWNISIGKDEVYCPTCIIQFYHGIKDVYTECLISAVISPSFWRNALRKSTRVVKMPEKPGIYPITIRTSMDYSCNERLEQHTIDWAKAIGVIRVKGKDDGLRKDR